MAKIITNKEIIEGAKNWLASLSNAEWSKKLEEENERHNGFTKGNQTSSG